MQRRRAGSGAVHWCQAHATERQRGETMGTSLTHLGRARGRASRAAPISIALLLALAALLIAGCSVDVGGDNGGSAAVGEPAANDKMAVTVHSTRRTARSPPRTATCSP